MDIYTIMIAASILVYIAIGGYAGRGIRDLDDYYVAGRRAPTLIIVGTLVASLMSSTMFLGEAGFSYAGQAGPYVLFPQTACIGYVIGALFFGRYLRRSRATTVADFFGQRFNSTRVQALAGFTIIFALGGYLLAVTQGAGILLSQLSDLSYAQALIVAWLSYTLFTIYSGSRGVILTDTLMFLVFTVASVGAIVFLVDHFGGWPSIIEDLVAIEDKADLMSWHGIVGPSTEWPTPMDYLIWALVIDFSWMLVYSVSPWQSSRHLMAKNEHVVLRAAIIACVVVALLQVMVYGMGGVINLGKSDIEPYESATIWASLYMLPKALGALMLAGIVAAILSSASTFLSLVGFSASNDIGIHKSLDDKKTLFFSRMMMLVIGTFVLGAALVFPADIFWLTTFIATVFASSWGPVGFMSIWSKRITESAAFWGMLSGLVLNVVPKFFEFIEVIDLPSYLDPAIIGAVASLTVTIAVSRLTIVSEKEKSYIQKLHQAPAEEIDSKRTRTTYFASTVLIANGLIMPFVLINYYVHPYQSATGTLLPDGSLDWFTGEAILALCWFALYVPLGVFAISVIRKAYGPVQKS
ncbi:MAG: sodium:solute symporter family protein [Proteobacteria bacterium]|nr:sodium:solute symporter family protein [Pseudomonadota bacterium]MDA1064366.1 sodium:solute symporter family protein [Pseudomonadota bacterium]